MVRTVSGSGDEVVIRDIIKRAVGMTEIASGPSDHIGGFTLDWLKFVKGESATAAVAHPGSHEPLLGTRLMTGYPVMHLAGLSVTVTVAIGATTAHGQEVGST